MTTLLFLASLLYPSSPMGAYASQERYTLACLAYRYTNDDRTIAVNVGRGETAPLECADYDLEIARMEACAYARQTGERVTLTFQPDDIADDGPRTENACNPHVLAASAGDYETEMGARGRSIVFGFTTEQAANAHALSIGRTIREIPADGMTAPHEGAEKEK